MDGAWGRAGTRTCARRLLAGLAAVLLLPVGGCLTDPVDREPVPTAPTPSPTASPTGIALSFIQQRFDEGTDKAAITVINRSGHPVTVRRVGLDWPGYPSAPQRQPYVVYDGQTVDLHYRLPEPACAGSPLDVHPVGVLVTPTRTVRRPIDAQGLRFLDRIWRAACNERLLHRTVGMEYAGPWRQSTHDDEMSLTGALVLTRRSSTDEVHVEQVQGSPLFDLALGTPDTLAAGDQRVAVPLRVTSGGRCDPHSRAAVTTPFTFRLWLRIGVRQVAVVAVPDKPAQRAMLAFLDRACAAG